MILIYCELCHEHIANAFKEHLKAPLMGSMFRSPDELHERSCPFDGVVEWEWMRCPECRWRPFTEENRLNEVSDGPGSPRYALDLPAAGEEDILPPPDWLKVVPEETGILTCDLCGKKYGRRQMAIHKKNHKRSDKRREQRALVG